MNQKNQLRKNPSRETCESIIRRILMTELTQNGKNRHFRKAADFMSYFESLYPASDALTKQVQRAVQTAAFRQQPVLVRLSAVGLDMWLVLSD